MLRCVALFEKFCGGLLATIKRPDVGNNVGNVVGNDHDIKLTVLKQL